MNYHNTQHISPSAYLLLLICMVGTCVSPLQAQESCYEQYLREHNMPFLTAEDADDSYEELKKEVLARQAMRKESLFQPLLLAVDTLSGTCHLLSQDGTLIADVHLALVDSTWYMWLSVDPLADKYPGNTPYMYCNGNPIMLIDPDGKNPIYDQDGNFLGTDEKGLQGVAIIMDSKLFQQNMSSEIASAFDIGTELLTDEAYKQYFDNYTDLSHRPDWDGIITLDEANSWYRNGSGNPLYANLGAIDMSGIVSLGEKYVGQKKSFNLLLVSNSVEAGLVYGQIVLKRYPNHKVRAYSDTYNFEMHSWRNPLNWGRNVETIIGNKVAGEGIPYTIHFYGSQTLTPILPWIK